MPAIILGSRTGIHASGGVAAFDPIIYSPVGWWKGYNTAASSDATDLSGNSHNLIVAGTTTSEGVLNGHTGIRTNAAGAFATGGFALNAPISLYILINQKAWTVNQYLLDGNVQDTFGLYQRTASPNLELYAGASGPNSADLAVNTPALLRVISAGASSTLRVNNGTPATGNAGAANPGGFSLGSSVGGLFPVDIIWWEALLFSGDFNTAGNAAKDAAITNYLGNTIGGLGI